MGEILNGDALEVLRGLPDASVDMCVTSPPYYALRDYGTGEWVGGDPNCTHSKGWTRQTFHRVYKDTKEDAHDDVPYKKVCPICGAVRVDKQIGLEDTPEEYIQRLVDVFHEVKRVLKDDSTLWLNIGDSYWGSGSRGYDFTGKWTEASEVQSNSKGTENLSAVPKLVGNCGQYKNKDLIGIPWMLAFALRNDGWYLRQDIIWAKPNPMPESVRDRCTKSHEYIFLLSKTPHYHFDADAIKEQSVTLNDKRMGEGRIAYEGKRSTEEGTASLGQQAFVALNSTRNKRDVWNISVSSIPDAHFATFPEALIRPCILAGCKEGGIVLDPFFGSGTTGRVATALGRDYIGIELNPKYIEIAEKRTDEVQIEMGV